MPGQIHARNLFEQAAGSLEDDQIWEGNHAAGGPQWSLIVKFHEMHAHQTQIHHFADNIAYLYAISDAYAVFTDEEEIADDRNEDALHGDCNAGGDESREGRKTADFRDKAQSNDGDDEDTHQNRAHQQQMVAAPRFAHITQHGATPNFRDDQDRRQQPQHDAETHRQHFPRVEGLTARR